MATIATDHPFVVMNQSQIAGVLSCFDRVIFRGYLPLSYAKGMRGFRYGQKIQLKDFKDYAPQVAERVKEHVKTLVAAAGAPYRHLPTKEPMEQQARQMAKDKGIHAGIVCVYSQLETCRAYRFEYQGLPRLRPDFRRCLVAVCLRDARGAGPDPCQAAHLVSADDAGLCQRP